MYFVTFSYKMKYKYNEQVTYRNYWCVILFLGRCEQISTKARQGINDRIKYKDHQSPIWGGII